MARDLVAEKDLDEEGWTLKVSNKVFQLIVKLLSEHQKPMRLPSEMVAMVQPAKRTGRPPKKVPVPRPVPIIEDGGDLL